MGDKSPKSQQKNKKQKKSKTDAANQKKAGAIARQQQVGLASKKQK